MDQVIEQLQNKGFQVEKSKEVRVFKDMENMPFEDEVVIFKISKNGQVIKEYQELFPFSSNAKEFFNDFLIKAGGA